MSYRKLAEKFCQDFLPHDRVEVELTRDKIDTWIIQHRDQVPEGDNPGPRVPKAGTLKHKGFVHNRATIIGKINAAARKLDAFRFKIDFIAKEKDRYIVRSTAISAAHFDAPNKQATRAASLVTRIKRDRRDLKELFKQMIPEERSLYDRDLELAEAEAEIAKFTATVRKKLRDNHLERIRQVNPNSKLLPEKPALPPPADPALRLVKK